MTIRIEFQFPVFTPPMGGVENYILECARTLKALGHEIQVFCEASAINEREEIKENQNYTNTTIQTFRHKRHELSTVAMPFRPIASLRHIQKVFLHERPDPDIIVARYPTYAIASSRCQQNKAHVIYLPAEEMTSRWKRQRLNMPFHRKAISSLFYLQYLWLEHVATKSCDTLMTLSKNMAMQMCFRGRRFATINPPGVNRERFHQNNDQRVATRSELGVSDDLPIVLLVGRLSPEKNQTFALEVLSRITTNYLCLILGDGDEREALENRAKALNIYEHCRFLGLVSCPENYYMAADILLHPAWQEPFGHVLLEAMASGLVVIAADDKKRKFPVANQEILADNAGFLIDIEDVESSVSVLQKVLGSPALREECKNHALSRLNENYLWEKHVECLLNAPKLATT